MKRIALIRAVLIGALRKFSVVAVVSLAVVCLLAQQASHTPVNKDQVDRWMTELSNWGRWGKDDRLGALNLITPAKKREAMALARQGIVVSLEQPIKVVPKPDETKADGKPHGVSFYEIRFKTFPADDPRGNPGFTSDVQEYHVHGGMTHLDALCHDSSDGKLYNGYPIDTVDQDKGCTRLSLDQLPDGIVTRGVLVDMTRLKGASGREPGLPVYAEDIEAWEKQTGLTVSPGDALFVYNSARAGGRGSAPGVNGGFDLSVLPWMKRRGVAMTSGVRPIPEDRHADHRLVLVSLGVYLLDGVQLDRLAETAARLNRWEFLLVVAPLKVPGSTGSPVNPLAMF
jgi:kynurenine formamidase